LVVYYSRSGISKTVAENLAAFNGWDIDRIEYPSGRVSYIKAGSQAIKKATAEYTGDTHDPSAYSEVVFLSPIWASSLSTPIRSYMKKHAQEVASYSLIVTMGGSGAEGAKADAEAAMGKAPKAFFAIRSVDAKKGAYDLKGL